MIHIMLFSDNSIAWFFFSQLLTFNFFRRFFFVKVINFIFHKRFISYTIHSKFAITCIITRSLRHFKIRRITIPRWIIMLIILDFWIDISLMIIWWHLLWKTSILQVSLILKNFFIYMIFSKIFLNYSFILWRLNIFIFSWVNIIFWFIIFVGYSRKTFFFSIIIIFRRHRIHIIIIIFKVLIHFFFIFSVSNFFNR